MQPNRPTPATAELVVATLKRHTLETGHLVLEVTEDQAAEVSGSHLEAMDLLVHAGVAIAIDDIGTGYAGLAAFRALPWAIFSGQSHHAEPAPPRPTRPTSEVVQRSVMQRPLASRP